MTGAVMAAESAAVAVGAGAAVVVASKSCSGGDKTQARADEMAWE